MILHILNGISWAVATSSIEKAVIDVFHNLFVEKQWHGFLDLWVWRYPIAINLRKQVTPKTINRLFSQ
ncbi:hypothetical protein P4V58_27475 [Bacillus wiedmannii]|uniref:hypothetical protein n=1 Tax=Bacillus wiedmannii TaxID=1890302 RepID=UPI002E1DE2AD|nr:hypothetical protein [Bacillus wiedmannii]